MSVSFANGQSNISNENSNWKSILTESQWIKVQPVSIEIIVIFIYEIKKNMKNMKNKIAKPILHKQSIGNHVGVS